MAIHPNLMKQETLALDDHRHEDTSPIDGAASCDDATRTCIQNPIYRVRIPIASHVYGCLIPFCAPHGVRYFTCWSHSFNIPDIFRPDTFPGQLTRVVATLKVVFESGKTTIAVDGVSLDVEPGEFVSIIGPSGCGKSTVLNVIAGFTQASSGEVRVDGKIVEQPGIDRRRVLLNYSPG